MSDLDGGHRFIVCKYANARSGVGIHYEMIQLFGHETWEVVVDELDGSSVTVIRREGEVITSAGEFCGEYPDRGQARIAKDRLQRILEVMES